MRGKICYLGDGSLHGDARYLAGIIYCEREFHASR